jgi:hypothetical protein
MSDLSPHQHGAHQLASNHLATKWPGLLAPFVRDSSALGRFFPGSSPKWSDALVARTRRHIGGVVATLEKSFRATLADNIPGQAMDHLPNGLCWRAIEQNPDLIAGDILTHFTTRAAISLMHGPDSTVMVHADGAVPFAQDDVIAVRDAAFALSRSLHIWRQGGEENSAIPCDLPAEYIPTLLWLIGALVAQGIARMDVMADGDLLVAVEQGGQQILAGHDEQTGAFGQASLLAHYLRDRQIAPEIFDHLAQDGHYLQIFAIIADRCGISAHQAAAIIVHGTAEQAHQLFRAADMPAASCAITLLALRQVRDGLSDIQLEALFQGFESLSLTDARCAIRPYILSAGFRDALGRIGGMDQR